MSLEIYSIDRVRCSQKYRPIDGLEQNGSLLAHACILFCFCQTRQWPPADGLFADYRDDGIQ